MERALGFLGKKDDEVKSIIFDKNTIRRGSVAEGSGAGRGGAKEIRDDILPGGKQPAEKGLR